MPAIHPVILSGGSGTRLWPVSRALFPKQLLPLASDKSMLQETVLRVTDAGIFAAPVIVANDAHRFTIAEQMREIDIVPRAILLEPEGRNTAPAIALAALRLMRDDPDAVMLVMPSDHVIRDKAAFLAAVEVARAAANANMLVTFGITPATPETGYGYIRTGGELKETPGCHAVDAFVEKPDAGTAADYLESGDYLWNSGMFLFRAKAYLDELKSHAPDVLAACENSIVGLEPDLDFERPGEAAFKRSPSISIDYAVMEKTGRAAVVPVDPGWSDLGSWAALWEAGSRDETGNLIQGDVMVQDVKNSLVRSDGPLVSVVGLNDVVVVATKDAVLVTTRERAQEVKGIVGRLKADGRNETAAHTQVFRPWGSYEGTDVGPRFQTKRLIVKPGAKLSLQAHSHRAEHWVVVSGTAKVTCGDRVFTLNEDESTYIPIGEKHRLENPGKIELHIIEVQSGSYLGEDDIIRYEDTYGRGNPETSN